MKPHPFLRRLLVRSALPAAVVAAVLIVPVLHNAVRAADSAGRVLWGGSVDGEVEVMIRRDSVKTHVVAGKGIDRPRRYFSDRMPSGKPLRVSLSRVKGRGKVEVFQQPGRGNDYTAGVRISDTGDGRSDYQFVLTWEPRQTR